MSERECSSPHVGWWECNDPDCPDHGEGEKPPLNADKGAQSTSQYGETVPESGNGVSDVENCPVVERLEWVDRFIKQFSHVLGAQGIRDDWEPEDVEVLDAFLSEIHDLEKKVEFGKDLLEIWTGHYDKVAAEGRKLEAENARLRKETKIAWAAAEHLKCERTIAVEALQQIKSRAYESAKLTRIAETALNRIALTGEQGGSRFTNDEQEQE